MSGREKKSKSSGEGVTPPPDSPRLTHSGRVVKNRLASASDAETADTNDTRKKTKTKTAAVAVAVPAPAPAEPPVVRRRGRPAKLHKTAPPDKKRPPAPPHADAAKTRARRRADDEPEGADCHVTVDEPKKQPGKAILNRIVKKKRLLALTKKKTLLSKKKVKKEIKRSETVAVKKRLSSKPIEVKLETSVSDDECNESSTAESQVEQSSIVAPTYDVKKEPEPSDAPIINVDSRSSSPRTRKSRTGSDLQLMLNSQLDAVSTTKNSNLVKSDRNDCSLVSSYAPQKLLRNGKLRSIQNSLLTGIVEQEKRKRKRVMSDSQDFKQCDLNAENLDEGKKIKRLRSFSRDGSEMSKCSDVTESDVSLCDNMSLDIDNKIEIKTECRDEKIQSNDSKYSLDGNEGIDGSVDSVNRIADVDQSVVIPNVIENDSSMLDDRVEKISNVAIDSDNNNTGKVEICDIVSENLDTSINQNEKITEKSLILDNMSKTFNDASLSEKTKSIRRSARQRKSTVKAKEHEESILVEKDMDERTVHTKGDDVENGVTQLLDTENGESHISNASFDPNMETDIKIISAQIAGMNSIDVSMNNANNENCDITSPPASLKSNEIHLEDVDKLVNEQNTEEDDCSDSKNGMYDSMKENIVNPPSVSKSYTHHDLDKLIDRLKCLEEQDRKRQEEHLKHNRQVMVTNDVVLIPKSNMENKTLKDIPNTVTLEKTKEKENVFNVELNSSISIIKKDHTRKSFEIDLPSSVTLIKRSGSTSRKHSTSSNSKDSDCVTMIDKSLGKEVPLDIRKSIDKGIISIETSKASHLMSGIQMIPSISKQKISIRDNITNANDTNSQHIQTSNSFIVDDAIIKVNAESSLIPISEGKSAEVSKNKKLSISLCQNESIVETPEKQKEKEAVLKTLGLVTLKVADQAKLDKQKQKELIKNSTSQSKHILKVSRTSPDKKKGRSSLKMTFQRSKNRNNKYGDSVSGDSESDENPYYTIYKEGGGSSGSGTGSSDNHLTSGGHRKTHYSNRFNHESTTQDPLGDDNTKRETNASSKETTTNLVIPEKASSFGIHPERLCQDQCFYCGGKFGLFDTPCHIAQIKSTERQKKILENEEKLTVDSCLCDACYRHVDRRANCPSYRKKTGPFLTPITLSTANSGDICYVVSCNSPAPHTLRRKLLVKMRKSICKLVQLDLDYPGLHTIPLCENHYQSICQLMVCGLCKRRLSKNVRVHYINQEYKTLNILLPEQNIPVKFEEKPVVCKYCRYFCTLLLRPPQSNQTSKRVFLKTHRQRLMQAHNVENPEDSDTDNTDEPSISTEMHATSKDKKRGKNRKNKSKKLSDNKQSDENSHNEIQHLSNKNHKRNEVWKNSNNYEHSTGNVQNSKDLEDIESLISSNKIMVSTVSGAKVQNHTISMDVGDSPNMIEYDNPIIAAIDKHSEYQSILQKCNVPSTTVLQRTSELNQKSKNILKAHNAASNNKTFFQKKLNRNERRILKLGQIITHKTDLEETLGTKIPNRDEFTIEPTNVNSDDKSAPRDTCSNNIIRNIALNDECTIETLPPKSNKNSVDMNSLKSKWVTTNSFSQIRKNLNALSKNFTNEQLKKKGVLDYQYSNPVQRLETNPSISVRELFPGEEEMNLQCSIEFGNSKAVTPEGWEKCNSTIQYDNYTKKLWQELQKPYGNQSSFLRHLILLEKYYRNGDLVLSQFANGNAVTYSESIQNRLRAYDNVPSNGGNISSANMYRACNSVNMNSFNSQSEKLSIDASRKNDSNVDFRKPNINIAAGKSLLKSNQNTSIDSTKVGKNISIPKSDNVPATPNVHTKQPKTNSNTMNIEQNMSTPKISKGMPTSLTHLEKLGNQLTPIQMPIAPRPSTPRPEISKIANEALKIPSLPATSIVDVKLNTSKSDLVNSKSKASSLPPELIAINQTNVHKNNKSIENVLKNIQQLTKAASTPTNSTPTTSQSLPQCSPSLSPIASTQPKPIKTSVVSKEVNKKSGKASTKQWRPTLIPITDETKARNGRDILHQTADGRRLPSLVQVMSGGKPYHITIQDYNRMCIMRREKLQQENVKKGTHKSLSPNNRTDGLLDANTVLQNKPSSPLSIIDIDKSPLVQSCSTKTSDQSALSSPITINTGNVDDNSSKGLLPEIDTSSLLKNVTLKNVTIAPIINSSEKSSINSSSPQSLLITNAKSVVQIPSIISQLSSSVSVTTETVLNSDNAVSPKIIPITSQAIILPKIPKSLTVIPQTVNTTASNGGSISSVQIQPATEALSVLPLPVTTTVSPSLTVSPSEP